MKKLVSFLLVVSGFILMTRCSKNSSNLKENAASNTSLAQLAAKYQDSTLSNNEMTGQFLYTHLKYYLGTNDLTSFRPVGGHDEVEARVLHKIDGVRGWSPDQIVEDLVKNQNITANEGSYLKEYNVSLGSFLQNNVGVDPETVWNFCLTEENKIRTDQSLTYEEKNQILLHHVLVRYALKWKLEQTLAMTKTMTNGGSGTQVNSLWSTIACFAGSISGYAGIATGFTGGNVLAAVIGAVAGVVNAIFTCNGSNTNVCQDPLTVSFPYQCYTYGTPLLTTAVGYGNVKPAQFVFTYADNDNLNNLLWSNFTPNNNIYLPGSYITSNITDIAVQCKTSCSNGNPLWFGWYKLTDLGKPYFTISGPANITVAQAGYQPSFEYDAIGPLQNTKATIQWQIIPSGYPNYSATGYFEGPSNSPMALIHWNASAGFATVQCTATVGCGTVVEYFSVHIM
jgi:hypothetical protein